jgi:glycosyltransferase involved in cell wall biosynthesis
VVKSVGPVHFTLAGPERPHAPGNITFSQYFHDQFPAELRPCVSFIGEVGDAQLNDLYRNCDLFVGPSLYESFGLIYIEAMRWGKPVLACHVGGVPEVVKDGYCGILVSPSNPTELAAAMTKLLHDHDLRARLGRQAFEWTARNFNISLMAERTEELYRDTAARFRRNAVSL